MEVTENESETRLVLRDSPVPNVVEEESDAIVMVEEERTPREVEYIRKMRSLITPELFANIAMVQAQKALNEGDTRAFQALAPYIIPPIQRTEVGRTGENEDYMERVLKVLRPQGNRIADRAAKSEEIPQENGDEK